MPLSTPNLLANRVLRRALLAACGVVTLLWLTDAVVLNYSLFHGRFQILRGPLRGNGLNYEISWLYVLIPLAVACGSAHRRPRSAPSAGDAPA